MALVDSKTHNSETRRFNVTPRYGAWVENNKFVIQVVLPGVKKENISIKALEDHIMLAAPRDDSVQYTLDLDFNFKIEPTKVQSHYHEGLLKLEFERYNALDHAFIVPIN
jgi:HSP20 family molecular chaperone IbpA